LLGFDAMNPPACDGTVLFAFPITARTNQESGNEFNGRWSQATDSATWQYLAAPLVEVAVCAGRKLSHDKHIDFH
jgi:hypothetical protein